MNSRRNMAPLPHQFDNEQCHCGCTKFDSLSSPTGLVVNVPFVGQPDIVDDYDNCDYGGGLIIVLQARPPMNLK